jgi:predicted transcriptional regulator of viral defense system
MTKREKLIKADKNILTIQDLSVIWNIENRKKLLEVIKYYIRKGRLKGIRRGVYSLSDDYDHFELAQKIIPLSYLSFYTALAYHGIIFQFYKTIHSMALNTKNIEIRDQNFFYHKIKSEIFFNSLGIEKKERYMIASPERAVCDTLYLKPHIYFDNILKLNIKNLFTVSEIYKNKRLEADIKNLIKDIKNA